MRWMVGLPLLVALVGVIWIFTIGTFFGLLLVIAGGAALGVNAVPKMVQRMGRYRG